MTSYYAVVKKMRGKMPGGQKAVASSRFSHRRDAWNWSEAFTRGDDGHLMTVTVKASTLEAHIVRCCGTIYALVGNCKACPTCGKAPQEAVP